MEEDEGGKRFLKNDFIASKKVLKVFE